MKKTLIITMILSMLVAFVALLNLQTDDEIYIGTFDYESVPEDADFAEGVITVRDDMGLAEGSVIAEIPAIHVDAGSYTIDTDHQGDDRIEVIIYDGREEIDKYILPKNETNTRYTFSSDKNLYNLRVVFLYNGEGTATIKRSIIYADKGLFYSDTIVYAILIISAVCILGYLLSKHRFFQWPVKDRVCVLVVLFYLLMINYMYYRPFPLDAEDTGYHVARIEATYNEIRWGQVPTIMYSDFVHGRGMIGIMYPYLFLVIPAMLRMMHVSPEGAIRLFFIFITYATCAIAYETSSKLMKNRYVASASMMLYGMLIYRMNTMTYRYAYGELQAFIFFPLVIWGLYEIFIGDRKKWPVLALGMTGLMQCHLISFLQAVVVCVGIGGVFLTRLIKEHRILQVLFATVTTILLNLWYILPFMTYYKEDLGIYDHLSWGGDIYRFSSYLTEMIRLFPNTSEGETQHKMGLIGLWLVIMAGTAIYLQIKMNRRTDKDNFALVLLIIGAFALFMASKTFPWQTALKFSFVQESLEYLQFVGRFYMIGEIFLFFGSILTIADHYNGISIGRTDISSNMKVCLMAIIILTAAFQAYAVSDSWLAKRTDPFAEKNEYRYIAAVNDTTVEDYVPNGYWFGEGFAENAYSPTATITDYEHKHLSTSFEYTADSQTYVEIPILYYKGYAAFDDKGEVLSTEKGTAGSIRVSVPASKDKTNVTVSFRIPIMWRFALVISAASLCILVVYGIWKPSNQKGDIK